MATVLIRKFRANEIALRSPFLEALRKIKKFAPTAGNRAAPHARESYC